MTAAASWHPDPYARFQLRFWDGTRWTDDVSTDGVTLVDPASTTSGAPAAGAQAHVTPVRQVGEGQPGTASGGTIFTEPVLVVSRVAKVLEITKEFTIFDQHGQEIGAVGQVGMNAGKKVLAATVFSQYTEHKWVVHDRAGAPQLQVIRPAQMKNKTTLVVASGEGREIGSLSQDKSIGKVRFSLSRGDHKYGSFKAENWRAWDFNICDQGGTELARITKKGEKLAKNLFATANSYVVQVHRPLREPLRSLVLAAALTVDTALKPGARARVS